MRTPAGLLDKNFEYFEENGELYGIYGGQVIEWNFVPRQIEDVFFNEMINDESFILKCKRPITRDVFKKYLIDNYARLDHIPDLDLTTGKTNKELNPASLSPQEIKVVKEVATGDPDKWSSERLDIAKNTFRKHVTNISQKLNLHSKSAITKFAYENCLV